MAERRQTLRRELDGAVEWVHLDRQKFKQILLNLASNAVKFTAEEGEIAIRAGVAEDGRLRFEICDTGIGISEADRERLFVEFERLLPARSGQHPGTGLGLALTRRLVELQGGQIEVHSTPGVGSVFTVFLPLRGARG
jgi:signal transduction histidine kinase